jgi:hypothetical protein
MMPTKDNVKDFRKILWPWLKRPPVLTFEEWIVIADAILEDRKK